MRRIHADLLLLLIAVIWGVGFYFQKTAMAHVGPLVFLFARATIASLVLVPLALHEASRVRVTVPRPVLTTGLLAGLMFFVAGTLQQHGMITATVTNTGFLTALYVVLTPLLAWVVWRRRPTAYVAPAVALAFIGTWLLGGGTLDGFSAGDMLVGMSALFWAAHLLLTGVAATHNRPFAFAATQLLVVAVCAGPVAAALEPFSLEGLRRALPAILFVALMGSGFCLIVLIIAMRHTPPTEAAILISTEILFAAAAGAQLLGERLSAMGWLGAAMILAAMLLIQVGPALEARRRPPRS